MMCTALLLHVCIQLQMAACLVKAVSTHVTARMVMSVILTLASVKMAVTILALVRHGMAQHARSVGEVI